MKSMQSSHILQTTKHFWMTRNILSSEARLKSTIKKIIKDVVYTTSKNPHTSDAEKYVSQDFSVCPHVSK